MAGTHVEHGFTGERFPDLYTKVPPQPKEKKPGQLTEEQLNQYFQQGYVVVKDFFQKEELEACRADIEILVDNMAKKLFEAGKIKETFSGEGLFKRLTLLEKECPGTNIMLHKGGILPQSFRNVAQNEPMLNVMEQLLGPEVAFHPVWNLRTKTPQNEATVVPWHQDNSYFGNDAYNSLIPTAWIPLLDATPDNGCMQVVKGAHSPGMVATHQCCYGGTWYTMISEEEMEKTLGANMKTDVITCPVPFGGFLLINNMIPHQSLPNMSQDIRWSLDFRWQDATKPVGFYGLKDCVRLRSAKNPDLKPDWETFCSVDRTAVQNESVADINEVPKDDFDTTIAGPWMKKWEITHINRHTESWEKSVEMHKP